MDAEHSGLWSLLWVQQLVSLMSSLSASRRKQKPRNENLLPRLTCVITSLTEGCPDAREAENDTSLSGLMGPKIFKLPF